MLYVYHILQIDQKAKVALDNCYKSLNQTRDFVPVNFDDCDIMNAVGKELIQQ